MHIKNHPKAAIIESGAEITYTELLKKIDSLCALIGRKEFKAVIYSENRSEWIFAFYSAVRENGIAIPADYLLSTEELLYILDDSEPDIIFCSDTTLSAASDAAGRSKSKPKIINFDKIALDISCANAVEITPQKENETSFIIYTSGTTGSPKGVMLSHDNIQSNIESVTGSGIFISTDNVMVLLPLHHTFPLTGTMIAPLHTGATVVISPSTKPDDIRQTLKTGQITLLIGVPRLYIELKKGIEAKINSRKIARILFSILSVIKSKKISSKIFSEVHKGFGGRIRFLVSGGASLDRKCSDFFRTLGFDVLEGYGMTETAPMITCNVPGKIKPGSAGLVVKNMEIRIMDGEICTRGRNIMNGYYNKPAETNEIIKNGWLHTGDSGYIDKNGFLFITGRIKETIVLDNGKNINPEEIEKKLTSRGFIRECGVFYEKSGLKAVIVPDLQATGSSSIQNLYEYFKWNIIDKYNHSVPAYKKILSFTLTEKELPRTRLGKIQRFRLPSLSSMASYADDGTPEPEGKEYQIIKEYIQKEKSLPVKPKSHLEIDLGMDSLDKVALFSFIGSKFGIKIEDKDIPLLSTPSSLAEFIKTSNPEIMNGNGDWKTILSVPSSGILQKSRFPHMLLVSFFRICTRLIYKIETNFSDIRISEPVIIAPNHQSGIDWLFLASVLPSAFLKRTYIFAKEKHFRTGLRKFLARRTNIILIDIESGLEDTIRKMGEVLRNKGNIVIFPEGTRSKDGEIGDYKKTFSILSIELNVPIIPVIIDGAFRSGRKKSKSPRAYSRIKLFFMPEIRPQKMNYDDFTALVRDDMIRQLEFIRTKK